MSREEFLKIQTCVLKVHIHCDGCKQKVKKLLHKIEGVYTINIDSEQGKVTVCGNIDPDTLIRKLNKNGKHAELWGMPIANNGLQNKLDNQFKNAKTGKVGFANVKGVGQSGIQQLQKMKGFQDLNVCPQGIKEVKVPFSKGQNQKSVKFKLPPQDTSDDDFDESDEDDNDGYESDDDMVDVPSNMLLLNGGNPKGRSRIGGSIPVQMSTGGTNDGKGGNGKNSSGNQNQGGGMGAKNGGGQPQANKNGAGAGGVAGAPNGNRAVPNGDKKGVGSHQIPNIMSQNAGGTVGQMRPMGQMGSLGAVRGLPTPGMHAGGVGNASSHFRGAHPQLMAGAGAGAGHFPGARPELMAGDGAGAGYLPGARPGLVSGNGFYQQQLAGMAMNRQHANRREMFQPMMYAPPPPAVNYMPPTHPYPYYQSPSSKQTDPYAMFSDENASSCIVM